MKIKIFFFFIFLVTQIVTFNCKEIDDNQESEGIESNQAQNTEPKYYTPKNEGRWDLKSDTHTPIVKFLNKKGNIIKITVPFIPQKSPRHYIEMIALMQGKKQIAIKKINFSLSKAIVKFELPDPDRNDYWVVAKCNQHDMWRAPVQRNQKK